MRIVILTCSRNGSASRCLDILSQTEGIEIVSVILAMQHCSSRFRRLWRTIKKVLRIGFIGAANGVRMRKWYWNPSEDIEDSCRRLNLPFQKINGLNSLEMIAAFQSLHPDLGVSLGNSFISPRVFELPRLGMINLHTEILPAYQNAQSIIWPIYCNDPYTGYTIHEIERQIDAGRILFQRHYPIEFRSTLAETVRVNVSHAAERYPTDIAYVVSHINELKAIAQTQEPGGKYTTPSIWQYLRMVRNNKRFYKKGKRDA